MLIHCFAGCGAADVIAAMGLEFSDLFPDKPTNHFKKSSRPNHWHSEREALRVIRFEAQLVAVAADNIANGIELASDELDRLVLAAQRISNATESVQ